MAYFKHFPKMYYDVRGSETVAQHLDVDTAVISGPDDGAPELKPG